MNALSSAGSAGAGAGAAGSAAGAAGAAGTAAASGSFLSNLVNTGATLGQASAKGGGLGSVVNSLSQLFGKEGLSSNQLSFLDQVRVGGDPIPAHRQQKENGKPQELQRLFSFLAQ